MNQRISDDVKLFSGLSEVVGQGEGELKIVAGCMQKVGGYNNLHFFCKLVYCRNRREYVSNSIEYFESIYLNGGKTLRLMESGKIESVWE
ncbi:hypothetical protein HC766_07630 [Candidatus Gracilibacteria bacterium]|nr:hypothetical protein [Candidatus Gracilibacteria bacterium]